MCAVAPLILVDPLPRTLDMICDGPTRRRLETLGRLIVSDREPMPDAVVEQHLPDAVAIVGQTDLPAERLARAPNLRAVVNIEGNFLPNVDYAAARERLAVLFTDPVRVVAGLDEPRDRGAEDRQPRRTEDDGAHARTQREIGELVGERRQLAQLEHVVDRHLRGPVLLRRACGHGVGRGGELLLAEVEACEHDRLAVEALGDVDVGVDHVPTDGIGSSLLPT